MFYRVNTTKLQIRNGPGINYTDIGDLFMVDEIEVTETLGGWHRVAKIKRAGTDVYINPPDVNASWCSAVYTIEIVAPNPDPDPEPTPEPTVKPLIVQISGEGWETVIVTVNPKA